MNISLIYADNHIVIKRVDYMDNMNKFLYKVTYILEILDNEGHYIKEIRICEDGKIFE